MPYCSRLRTDGDPRQTAAIRKTCRTEVAERRKGQRCSGLVGRKLSATLSCGRWTQSEVKGHKVFIFVLLLRSQVLRTGVELALLPPSVSGLFRCFGPFRWCLHLTSACPEACCLVSHPVFE